MPKKIDLTNKKFGEWTVIREATKEEKNNRPGAYWLCQCSCGNKRIMNGQVLREGESNSCGCQTSKLLSEKSKEKAEDLTGKIFGQLTVLSRDYETEAIHPNRGSTYWRCKCSCGNEISVLRSSLLNQATKSCGCLRKKIASKNMSLMSSNNYIDETGKRYGKLTVIQKVDRENMGRAYWLCQCDCGKQTIVSGASLRNGNTLSCGCLGTSKGEFLIEKILNDNNILFIKEYPIYIQNKRLRYDFAVLDNNNIKYIIEFDGEQHYIAREYFGGEPQLKITQEHDKIKNQWCKDNNIPLIRIPYTHYNNLCIEDLKLETSKFLI
jgi:hypothetical protein